MFMLPFFWTAVQRVQDAAGALYLSAHLVSPSAAAAATLCRIWQVGALCPVDVRTACSSPSSTCWPRCWSSSAVAYGFSRYRFQGGTCSFVLLLSTMMLPAYVTIIPSFLMYRVIGLDRYALPADRALLFWRRGVQHLSVAPVLYDHPLDFDEAAYVDGASSFTIFWKLILPLSKPALSTVAIFAFLGSWNNFLGPLIFLNTTDKFTLPLGITYFRVAPMERGEPRDHLLMAASVTITMPAVILFFAAQRYFISGIVMSGLKG